jgi:hypothetical protein
MEAAIVSPVSMPTSQWLEKTLTALQDVVGTDDGNRGMKALIVPEDFGEACKALGRLLPSQDKAIIIVSGFPCHVNEVPPTETDGPGGTVAIAKAAIGLGHHVQIITDDCNEIVFSAAMKSLPKSTSTQIGANLVVFPSSEPTLQDEQNLLHLIESCQLLIACERAGPSDDGNCYTMRGINMTKLGLIAPLISSLTKQRKCKFIAIGDGGNELGMGKVLDAVKSNIPNGEKIACVVTSDYLIAASVSNWGAYALAAGAGLVRAHDEIMNNSIEQPTTSLVDDGDHGPHAIILKWIDRCIPTDTEERTLLEQCVAVGCRDGVTGRLELSVDGMPLEESMQCMKDIREKVLHAFSLDESQPA